MDEAFFAAADAAGCSLSDYFTWDLCPELFAESMLASAKRYARFLKDHGLVRTHSQALETVAKAGGFPHWHSFQTVVQGLLAAFDPDKQWPRPEGGREPIRTLIPAFFLMVKVSPDCVPTPKEQAGLSKAAAKLALACGRPVHQVLDIIGKMNGADDWARLLSRKPENAVGPLYGFQVLEDGRGTFTISSACSALIDQQDALFQGFHYRPKSEQEEFESQLERVLDARPDFLEGLLAKAEVLKYQPTLRRQQGKIYNEAIRQANALLPSDFKGEISWYDLSNRFYHRLLYGAMVWHATEGHTTKALALARRQLRLNKSDNLGVRLWLPVLLVADGQASTADKASKKMTLGDGYTDAAVELVHAICHFANQRFQQSAECLYLSLFNYPPTKHVISVNWRALADAYNDQQSRRTVVPDAEAMVEQFVTASMRFDGLGQTFERWLRRPAVEDAESMLAREFHSNWRQPNGSIDRWDAEVLRSAKQLSQDATTD